jgi:phosphoribosyl-AMP cyclohydrolase
VQIEGRRARRIRIGQPGIGSLDWKIEEIPRPRRDQTIVRDSIEPLPLADVLKWSSDGLIPAIVQDVETGDVLMLAWMDEPALRATIATGQTHFYSRSRRSHWHKGGTSGHVQHVESIWVDCDGDVILIKARQVGGACHEGYRSCFFRRLDADGLKLEVAAQPVFDAAAVYGPAESHAILHPENRLAGTGREMPD